MAQNIEKKNLQNILKSIETEKVHLYNKVWFDPVLWFICAGAFVSLAKLHENNVNIYIIIVCSALVGLVFGIVVILQISNESWLHIKKHINVQSIKDRINEIST